VRLRVAIDEDRCIGCGACEELCPEVFEVGDDGLARVVTAAWEPFADRVTEAAEDCPQGAILVEAG